MTGPRTLWRDLKAYPPAAPGWYWAWDGHAAHPPVTMQYTGPGWLYVGRLGGTLEQVAWHYPWYYPVAIPVPATEEQKA